MRPFADHRNVVVTGASLAGHDWPLALSAGGYERGPAGLTIAGEEAGDRQSRRGRCTGRMRRLRPELTVMSRGITAMEEQF